MEGPSLLRCVPACAERAHDACWSCGFPTDGALRFDGRLPSEADATLVQAAAELGVELDELAYSLRCFPESLLTFDERLNHLRTELEKLRAGADDPLSQELLDCVVARAAELFAALTARLRGDLDAVLEFAHETVPEILRVPAYACSTPHAPARYLTGVMWMVCR